jgi:hypothetical protein
MQTNTEKFEKWFPENHFPENKYSQKGKHFPGNQTKFFFDWKVFSLTGKCFSLTRKCFSLTNFPNDKQTQENLESDFPETIFRETNMTLNFTSYFFTNSGKKNILKNNSLTSIFFNIEVFLMPLNYYE